MSISLRHRLSGEHVRKRDKDGQSVVNYPPGYAGRGANFRNRLSEWGSSRHQLTTMTNYLWYELRKLSQTQLTALPDLYCSVFSRLFGWFSRLFAVLSNSIQHKLTAVNLPISVFCGMMLWCSKTTLQVPYAVVLEARSGTWSDARLKHSKMQFVRQPELLDFWTFEENLVLFYFFAYNFPRT